MLNKLKSKKGEGLTLSVVVIAVLVLLVLIVLILVFTGRIGLFQQGVDACPSNKVVSDPNGCDGDAPAKVIKNNKKLASQYNIPETTPVIYCCPTVSTNNP